MTLPPGPRAPRAVQTVGFLLRPASFMQRCRRRFGGTFTLRIARAGRMVFISDPPSLKALFAADRVNTIAPGRNVILAPLLGRRSLLLLEGPEHLRRRRLMLPPFHGERMRAYERTMEEATESEMASWPAGEPFPLHPSMQAITLEVIMRAVFGVGEDRRQGLRQRLLRILAATRSPLTIGFTIPAVVRAGGYPRLRRNLAEADRLLLAEIAERRSDPGLEDREDILSMLVAARDEDGEGMDDRELRDQLMTLLLAGHETTATALAWAFDLLFRNPAAMRRLRKSIVGEDDDYLDAVAEETLRLRPVVPFVGRQLGPPAELGGHELPAGTVVMPAIYLAHTRPDLYPEPYEFRPDRFLGDDGPDTYSWIPFGGGTRRCLGAAFAQLELRVVLRTILRGAVLRGASAGPERIVRRNVTLSPRHGTLAVLER